MFKTTHQPRGHPWTCASQFQQLKRYRNINYSDCMSPGEPVLVPGSDDELSPDDRAAKRQRIETLADSHMNGETLQLVSARPSNLESAGALQWIIKTSSNPKSKLFDFVGSDIPAESIWLDEDDNLEILKKHLKKAPRKSTRPSRSSKLSATTTEVTVRSHLQPRRTRQAPKLFKPSKRSNVQANQAVPSRLYRETTVEETDETDGTEDDDATIRGGDSEDLPVLRSSSIRDNITVMSMAPATPTPMPRQELIVEEPAHVSDTIAPTVTEQADINSFKIAPADTEADEPAQPSASDTEPESQAALLKKLFAAPRKSWTALNENENVVSTMQPHSEANDADAEPATSFEFRQLIHDSAEGAGKARNVRRKTSSGKATSKAPSRSNRRKSAPTESQNAMEEMTDLPVDQQRRMSAFRVQVEDQNPAYTALLITQNGSTPFMYRKRTKGHDDEAPDVESPGQLGEDLSTPSHAPAANAPMLDLEFSHNSSLGFNMVLGDKHVNTKLPVSPQSHKTSASTKKAIRREMHLSGAEITRTASQDASSQAPIVGEEPTEEDNTEILNDAPAIPPESWQGTQVLLNQAQQNLFSSPMKQMTQARGITQGRTPKLAPNAQTPQATLRQSIRNPGQENIPTADTPDMGQWSPWSTIKKLKSIRGKAMAPPPPFLNPASEVNLTARTESLAGPPDPFSDSNVRRSSLRFATSVNSSPFKQGEITFAVRKSQEDSDSQGSKGKEVSDSDSQGHLCLPSSKNRSTGRLSTPFSTTIEDPSGTMDTPGGLPLPSYQAAQMSIDVSDLEGKIDDVVNNALHMSDIDGLFTQPE